LEELRAALRSHSSLGQRSRDTKILRTISIVYVQTFCGT